MPVNKDLLDILCCPKTKVPIKMLGEEQREKANTLIRTKSAVYADGSAIEEELSEALITEDGQTIYRVDDSIPIMTIEKGIPTEQFGTL